MIKLALSLYLTTTSINSFEYKTVNPSTLFPYTVATQDYSHPSTITNPAYLSLLKQNYITGSKEYVYSLNEVESSYLSVGFFFRDLGINTSWHRFGIKEYFEDQISTSIGYRYNNFISIGLSQNYYILSVSSNEQNFSDKYNNFSSSILIIPKKWIHFSFIQKNIFSINNKNQDSISPESSGGISVQVSRGLWFYWNLTNTYNEKINSFSTSINLLNNLSLRLGYTKESSSYSTAILIKLKKITTSYGFRFHPYLGNSYSFGLTISNSSKKFIPLNYNKNYKKRKKRININNSNLKQLLKNTSLTPLHAKRIIKYKKIIGPISKKTLGQIGLSSKEKRIVLNEIYGLQIPIKKKFKRYNRYKKKNKIKYFFVALLKTGIDPTLSLELSKIAKRNNKKSVKKYILRNSLISKLNKEKLLKLCSKYL